MPANTSNWGAYAVEAAPPPWLAGRADHTLGRDRAAHDRPVPPPTASTAAPAGIPCRSTACRPTSCAIVTLLGCIVRNGLVTGSKPPSRRAFRTETVNGYRRIVGDSIDRATSDAFRAPACRAASPIRCTGGAQEAGQAAHLAGGAKLLVDKVKAGQHVFVVTGAGTPPGLPAGEDRRPAGAAAIARAIEVGLGPSRS